jgi:hypothetical protein
VLNNDLLKPLQDGTWEMDCLEITLTPNDEGRSDVLKGPGYLRQEKDGTITFKQYTTSRCTVEPFGRFQNMVPGKLIEHENYHRFQAIDKSGREWTFPATLVQVGGYYGPEGLRPIVTGDLQELSATRSYSWAPGSHSLTLVIFLDVKVPCNAVTESHTSEAGKQSLRSSWLNLANFQAAGWDFRIKREEGLVTVRVNSSTRFPDDAPLRITEALGFVLGHPFFWNMSELVEDRDETIRIRGKRHTLHPKIRSPIYPSDIDSTRCAWRMFDCYLRHVLRHNQPDRFHPCTRYLFSVLEASAGTIGAQALALGVAVEGLAKELFPEAGQCSQEWKELVTELRQHCLGWDGFSTGRAPQALSKRLPGLFGQLVTARAKDRLFALVDRKVVQARHVEAWSRLRNATAHGVTSFTDSLQELVDLCSAVTVLMYHLIFHAIGYEGVYTDYSTHHFPYRLYFGRAPQHDEIAVCAYRAWEREGHPHGQDVRHWLEAEKRLEEGLVCGAA